MQTFTRFNNRVQVALTERAEGNMKVTPKLSGEQQTLARQSRLRAIEALSLSDSTTALLRVTYNQEDFCKFLVLDPAGKGGRGMQLSAVSLEHDLQAAYSDGILTRTSGLGIFLPLADCLGLVLFDPKQSALMVVHCGRHTLLQQGASKAVRFMSENVGTSPEDLLVWTSPSAGRENYPLYDAGRKGLLELAVEQLTSTGVKAAHIEASPIDTTTSPNFFSHSQGDTAERFAICAKLM